MSIFGLPASNVVMSDWNILQVEIDEGVITELFIGYSEHDRLGRISTPIEDFDEEAGTGSTESGSTYQVIGKAGMPHDDAMYVLETRLGREKVRAELFSDDPKKRLRFRYPVE